MPLAPQQIRRLRARLKPQHIRTREAEGKTIAYLEGWHVIAEANRIFGFDGWDRELIDSACVYTRQQGERYNAAYTVRIRIRVRAGEHVITREGSGAGEASASSPGQAHELAMKAAETDATKRALMTFGNPFGLSLYGSAKDAPAATQAPPPAPRDRSGRFNGNGTHPGKTPTAGNGRADKNGMAPDNEAVSQQSDSVGMVADQAAAPNKAEPIGEDVQDGPDVRDHSQAGSMPDTHSPTKAFAVRSGSAPANITRAASGEPPTVEPGPNWLAVPAERIRIDKSALALAEPTRIRDQAHLKFVASQPCMICGRNKAQAHHLRFAQPKAMGRKVSDEYTVPLCSMHHRLLHETGNEIAWWEYQQIDPLEKAAQLWRQSRAAPQPGKAAPAGQDPRTGSG